MQLLSHVLHLVREPVYQSILMISGVLVMKPPCLTVLLILPTIAYMLKMLVLDVYLNVSD